VRGRIEAVLDWATPEYRQGENPARWRGGLKGKLPSPTKLHKVKHHPALAYPDMPRFMADLRGRSSVSVRALEFCILTAARTTELIGATWAEIDFTQRLWTVPASRMKSNREHRVPLSARATEILIEQKHAFPSGETKASQPLFANEGAPLSNNAMLKVLALMGHGDVTVHGTARSTFRDWAGDQTAFPREVIEMALAHAIEDKTEEAYRRSDALTKRRKLMDAWALYCARLPADADAVPLRIKRNDIGQQIENRLE
jgi:integrase